MTSRLATWAACLLAGQMSYERGASGSFASVWLPSGAAGHGPETVFVLHQSKFGVAGLAFQEMRFDQTEQFALSDRLSLQAGAEYLRAGFVSSVSALRPHARLDAHPGSGLDGILRRGFESPAGPLGTRRGAGIGDRGTG